MMKIKCPIHKVVIYALRYQKRIKGEQARFYNVDWYWCENCKKPIRVKIIASVMGLK